MPGRQQPQPLTLPAPDAAGIRAAWAWQSQRSQAYRDVQRLLRSGEIDSARGAAIERLADDLLTAVFAGTTAKPITVFRGVRDVRATFEGPIPGAGERHGSRAWSRRPSFRRSRWSSSRAAA